MARHPMQYPILLILACISQATNANILSHKECAASLSATKPYSADASSQSSSQDYEKELAKAKDKLAINSDDESAFAALAENAFLLAEIRSGNRDPRSFPLIAIDDGGKSDPAGYRLDRIKRRIGPNYWSSAVVQEFYPFLTCSVDIYIAKRPQFYGYIARKLAIQISSGRFKDAVDLMSTRRKIEERNSGEFYVEFTERFLGANDSKNATSWLQEVRRIYKINRETTTFWQSVIDRSKRSQD
jgi:hypothetical protein